jgi:hypothetical protein
MPDEAGVDASRRHAWVLAALLAGVAYFVIGRVFALPRSHVQVWRLAAWAASGAVYAAHLAHEHVRLRDRGPVAALRVALGVALGALALAVVAMLHSLSAAPTTRRLWFLALVLWPAVTALPAFLVARVVTAVLARVPRRGHAG